MKEILKIRPSDASSSVGLFGSGRSFSEAIDGGASSGNDSEGSGKKTKKSFSSSKGLFLSKRSRKSSSFLESENGSSSSTIEEMTRVFIINSASRSSRPKYVLKSVSEENKKQNKEMYLKGSIDLALESKFLSSLSHPNILDVRAVSSVGPFNEGYFIIIDRLQETLTKKISGWMTIDRQTKGVTGIFAGGKKKVDRLLTDRLSVAFEIASAMSYLHELRIIYRDLVRFLCNQCQKKNPFFLTCCAFFI